MYEIIIVVAAILTTLFICALYARTHGAEEELIEEVPDGGEDIAAPSQSNPMSTNTNINQEQSLETAERAKLTEFVQAPLTAPSEDTASPVEPTIEIEIQSSQETAPVELPKPTEFIAMVEPATVQPQLVEQPVIPVAVEALAPVFQPEIHDAQLTVEVMQAPVDAGLAPAIATATEFDEPRIKVLEILSTGGAPKTVREIAQAFYGKGSYNKRKDSRIRRILAEMTQEGLLIETSIANSRAFEIKKAT